jgi:hypothetical protein
VRGARTAARGGGTAARGAVAPTGADRGKAQTHAKSKSTARRGPPPLNLYALRALLGYEAMQQNFYLPGTGLYRGESEYSFLWPFSQALAATITLSHISQLRPRLAGILRAQLVGLQQYLGPPLAPAEAEPSAASETSAATQPTGAPPIPVEAVSGSSGSGSSGSSGSGSGSSGGSGGSGGSSGSGTGSGGSSGSGSGSGGSSGSGSAGSSGSGSGGSSGSGTGGSTGSGSGGSSGSGSGGSSGSGASGSGASGSDSGGAAGGSSSRSDSVGAAGGSSSRSDSVGAAGGSGSRASTSGTTGGSGQAGGASGGPLARIASSVGLRSFNGNVAPPVGPGGDSYYDDNEWVGIELVRLYELDHDTAALQQAELIMQFVMSGWETTGPAGQPLPCPGGVPFSDARNNKARNTVTDAPGAELGVLLYKITHEASYLQFAEMAYGWVRQCLMSGSYLYADHIDLDGAVEPHEWSYNQGSMMGAGVLLFQATSDSAYLYQARQTAKAALAYFTYSRLSEENPFFVAVYFRNLMYLDSITHDPPGSAPAREYVYYAWQRHRLSDNLFAYGSPPTAELLRQAALVQIFALLSTPASTYF